VPEAETLTPVDLNLINDLWVPNVFIYNLKTFKVGYTSISVAPPDRQGCMFSRE
jgi:hypothetical protein